MFIRLTLYDGQALLVNVRQVEAVVPPDGSLVGQPGFESYATVDMLRDGNFPLSYDVKESVDEIHKLIEQALNS